MAANDIIVERQAERVVSLARLDEWTEFITFAQPLDTDALKALVGNSGPSVAPPNLHDERKYRIERELPPNSVSFTEVMKGPPDITGTRLFERRVLKAHLFQPGGPDTPIGIPIGARRLTTTLNVAALETLSRGILNRLWIVVFAANDILVRQNATLRLQAGIDVLNAHDIHIELAGRIICEAGYLRVNCHQLRGEELVATRPTGPISE
jgi:hypothetical protein